MASEVRLNAIGRQLDRELRRSGCSRSMRLVIAGERHFQDKAFCWSTDRQNAAHDMPSFVGVRISILFRSRHPWGSMPFEP
jgi:hypothetical protein